MALIQTAGRFQSSGVSTTQTYNASGNWTGGNTVIIVVTSSDGNAPTSVTVSGGAATKDVDVSNSSNTTIWRRSNVTGGSTAFAVTPFAATDLTVIAFERDDLAASPLDKTGTNSPGSGTSITVTASAANTNANVWVVTGFAVPVDQVTINYPSGYTGAYQDINFGFRASGAAYKSVAAIETSSATWTWNSAGFPEAALATYQFVASNPISIAWITA